MLPFAALVLVLVAPALLPAADEGTGRITVTVKDNVGGIPSATVRLTNEATRASSRATTDGQGVATFSSLAAGTYAVRAEFSGFAPNEQAGIALAAGEQKAVEATLTLAQFSTTVTVTTANRREELLLNVANPTTLIESSQIEDTGARSAKDVLVEQNGNGIQVQAGGGQGHVSINGIPNSGVLVLIDGRRYLGKDGTGNFNLEDLQLPGVERIEVVKGAGSALYGADALGGVINFISKRGGAPGFTNRIELTGGSYDDYRASDSLGWRGSRGGFSGYGGYRTYDGFDLSETNPQTIGQPGSYWWNGGGSADVQVSSKVVGRVFGDYQKRNIDPYYFSGATQLASTVFNSIRDLTRVTISPELEILPTTNTSINLTYTYSNYLREETRVFEFRTPVLTQPRPPWEEWNKEFKIIGRHAWKSFGQDNPLQGGYEYRTERLSRDSLAPANAQNPFGIGEQDRDINVFWLQQEINPTEKLKLAAGFRYDEYSDFGSEWSPKFAAVVSPSGNHRIRASYGHGFRAPTFGELYLNQPPFFVGNPDLKPETSDTVTGGYAYAGARVQGAVDYSYSKVKNGITFVQITPSSFTNGNVSEYTAKALNANVAVNLPGGFAPSVAYTYLRREDADGNRLSSYPTNAFFLKLLYSNPRWGLRANFRGQINGEQPPSLTDQSFVPAYDVWYIQVQKTILRRSGYNWSVFAQVDNLFDESDIFRRNASGQPIPNDFQIWLAPRTFQAGITIDMDWTH
jgi:outer membrane receptor for ferrienterochelin and colicins